MSTRKKPSPLQSNSTPSLPDELLLSCFARISRFYYPTLSLVSKRFRSLIVSPELYKTRSLLGQTESLIYVCLRFYTEPYTRWFILYPKPDRVLSEKKKSSGFALERVSILNSPPAHSSTVVAVGSSIYMLGGSKYKGPLSKVSILDCVSHTWCEGSSMGVERDSSKANVIDGKIYVAGGCEDNNPTNWMDVFDTKTETWEAVLNPLIEKCVSHVSKSAVIDDEIYMYSSNWGLAYKTKEDRWKALDDVRLELGLKQNLNCVIDNIIYFYNSHSQRLEWYNSKIRDWLPLNGLKTLLRLPYNAQLVNHCGKMVILWVDSSGDEFKKMISCEVIALERRTSEEIWGKCRVA